MTSYQLFLFNDGKSNLYMYSDDLDPEEYLDNINEDDMPIDDGDDYFDDELLNDPDFIDSILDEMDEEELDDFLDDSLEDIDLDEIEEFEDFDDIEELSEDEIQELLEAFDEELELDSDMDEISLDDIEDIEDLDADPGIDDDINK